MIIEQLLVENGATRNTAKATQSQINTVLDALDLPRGYDTLEWLTDDDSLSFLVGYFQDASAPKRLAVYSSLFRTLRLLYGEEPQDQETRGKFIWSKNKILLKYFNKCLLCLLQMLWACSRTT